MPLKEFGMKHFPQAAKALNRTNWIHLDLVPPTGRPKWWPRAGFCAWGRRNSEKKWRCNPITALHSMTASKCGALFRSTRIFRQHKSFNTPISAPQPPLRYAPSSLFGNQHTIA